LEESAWTSLVSGRNNVGSPLRLKAPLRQGGGSASRPFLGLGTDGRQWWVKAPLPNLDRALVTEFVVGKAGALIGAPVCEVELIHIGPEILPWEVSADGEQLVAGIGSATLNLDGTLVEIRPNLTHRDDNSNPIRQAGIYALVDWCFGADLQWLQRVNADWETHSHDHGWYLPPGGPSWSGDSLRAAVGRPCELTDDPAGLDSTEIDRLADALEKVHRTDLADVLAAVPLGWPVPDEDLCCLGWFLESRAPQVAARLRLRKG
jgi:hypothetical protein